MPRFKLTLLWMFLFVTGVCARTDSLPSWLDTVPPRVTASPATRYHNTILIVSLKPNEGANLWYSINNPAVSEPYKKPITLIDEGRMVVRYVAEDLVGNRSAIDSVVYIIDKRRPGLSIKPDPGRFKAPVMVRFFTSKPCRFFILTSAQDSTGRPCGDSMLVTSMLVGYISAVDSAGNKTVSGRLSYVVDSTVTNVAALPREGYYNKIITVSLSSQPPATLFYSFDPLAPPKWFTRYEKPVALPYGTVMLRYYARDEYGWESEIARQRYTIDTVPPVVHVQHHEGLQSDTVVLAVREPAAIFYELNSGRLPTVSSPRYTVPLILSKRGRCELKAFARDSAGNESSVISDDVRYDRTAPTVSFTPRAGAYIRSFTLTMQASEPARIFYTLDGSDPSDRSVLYGGPVTMSREGQTVVRLIALDEAENASAPIRLVYTIDSRPPQVRPQIEGSVADNRFKVTLDSDEPARIYYEIGERLPTESSLMYREPLVMQTGQVLRFFALDSIGNRSDIKVMDDLKWPQVSALPVGGIYNKALKVNLQSNITAQIFWRILPDTVFKVYHEGIAFSKEGAFSLEYYSETGQGLKSPIRRNEYEFDWTPPQVAVSARKGKGDSISVFFDASENVTIYYTLDGSDPLTSPVAQTAANKFLLASDRISVYRGAKARLTFFAVDIAGNRSTMADLDLSRPRAIANIPARADTVHDRILSISFSTFDKSQIFYARHGHIPTTDSLVFRDPISLLSSDTLMAFVVDAAGFHGNVDTFIYRIDLPPSPALLITPDSMVAGMELLFDAGQTVDEETPADQLVYRFDCNGDGVFERDFSRLPQFKYRYAAPGRFRAILEVKDGMQRVSRLSKEVYIQQICPARMVSITDTLGATFCIDRYEWPNMAGKVPRTAVSWVEAKMNCLDAGKRLCTLTEWQFACRGLVRSAYPYGAQYDPARCPTRATKAFAAGSFERCGERFGLRDMVGNVWEWVETKDGQNPFLAGGSYHYGAEANCNLTSPASVGARQNDVGFRCCK